MHWDAIWTRDLGIGSWYVAISTMTFVLKVVVVVLMMTVMINKDLRASYLIPNTVSPSSHPEELNNSAWQEASPT